MVNSWKGWVVLGVGFGAIAFYVIVELIRDRRHRKTMLGKEPRLSPEEIAILAAFAAVMVFYLMSGE